MSVPDALKKFATGIGKRIDGVDKETMRRLLSYSWPGNVRELENVVERGVILTNGSTLLIDPDMLASGQPPADALPDCTMQGVERDHILNILRQTRGVIDGPSGAAKFSTSIRILFAAA
jgi:DNA-binding NtrC family response regulator